MEDPPPMIITLSKIITESNRVIKSQHCRFYALAFLFLFPSSLISFLFQYYTSSLEHHFFTLTQPDPATIVALAVALFLFNLLFSIFALGSINYTVFHGFNGEPVDVKSAIRSIAASFFPLLSTALIVVFTVLAAYFLFVLALIALSPKSPYLIAFLTAIFVVAVLYIEVNWYLVYPVVVAESKRGFEALRRGRALITGKRMIALKLAVIFSLFVILLNSITSIIQFSADDWLAFAALILCYSILLTLCQLYSVVSAAVLYLYCNAGYEFSGEYAVLPVGDEKVAYVV